MDKPTVRSFPLIEAYHRKHIESTRKANLNRGKQVDSFLGSNGQEIKIICQPSIKPNWNICQIVQNSAPLGWLDVFEDSWTAIRTISDRLEREDNEFYPLRKDIFKVFDLCPLDQVKVVIMGQDPYHSTDHQGSPVAQGMSFSVKKGVTIPSSLQNIFKVLTKTVEGFIRPSHGDLNHWVRQGVFLLNADLTVLPHKAKSHHKYWISFINKVLKAIIETNQHVLHRALTEQLAAAQTVRLSEKYIDFDQFKDDTMNVRKEHPNLPIEECYLLAKAKAGSTIP